MAADEQLLSTKLLHTYQVPCNETGDSIEIVINGEKLRAENLNLQTWGSSLILATQLHKTLVDVDKLPSDTIQVLELGAGTALVGISAAAIWHANVVLTDLAGVVPGIAKNVSANQKVLSINGGTASCGTLDWNRSTELILQRDSDGNEVGHSLSSHDQKASIILAADTIYDEDHPEMLVNAISAWLRVDEQSRVLIAYPLRVAYLDAIRELWQRLEALGLEAMQEGKERTEEG